MDNEQMKFDFQTQDTSDMSELLGLMKQLDGVRNNLSELIKKHEDAEKKAESDIAVQKAYEMFVGKDKEDAKFSLGDNLEQECPVDEKVFDKEQTVDDFSILNIIPQQARKWVDRLTINEMIQAINDADKFEEYESEDEYVGQLVDNLKDMAVAKYTNDVLEGRLTKIDDEEIRSEVVDYMTKKGYNVPPTMLPALSKEEKLNKIIDLLDEGKELELDTNTINTIIKKLWKERNTIDIKIVNNKISLR